MTTRIYRLFSFPCCERPFAAVKKHTHILTPFYLPMARTWAIMAPFGPWRESASSALINGANWTGLLAYLHNEGHPSPRKHAHTATHTVALQSIVHLQPRSEPLSSNCITLTLFLVFILSRWPALYWAWALHPPILGCKSLTGPPPPHLGDGDPKVVVVVVEVLLLPCLYACRSICHCR